MAVEASERRRVTERPVPLPDGSENLRLNLSRLSRQARKPLTPTRFSIAEEPRLLGSALILKYHYDIYKKKYYFSCAKKTIVGGANRALV
jgi:hypothetical protein